MARLDCMVLKISTEEELKISQKSHVAGGVIHSKLQLTIGDVDSEDILGQLIEWFGYEKILEKLKELKD